MKLQFKEQDFQIQAVKAVVDCFAGQPFNTKSFTLERSAEIIRKAKQAASSDVLTLDLETAVMEDIGYRNSTIKCLETEVLKNIQAVQQQNDLLESIELQRPKGMKLE